MTITNFIPQNLQIDIFIAKEDIDSTDTVNLYEITDDPSGSGTLLANIKSIETDNDPSTGEAYLFRHIKGISTSGTYLFYYTTADQYGNESSAVTSFEAVVCLTPRAPSAMAFSELDFDGDNSLDFSNVILKDNVVAQYKMNDTAGTTVTDAQGSNNGVIYKAEAIDNVSNVTNTHSTLTKLDNYFDLYDGVNNYTAKVDDADAFSFTDGVGNDQPFSISAWINLDDISGLQAIVSKWQGDSAWEYLFTVLDGTLRFQIFETGSFVSFKTRQADAATITAGSWFLVTATYDGTELESGITLYVNNSVEPSTGSTSGTYAGMSATTAPVYIGCYTDAPSANRSLFIKGSIDNLIFFDKELNIDEIKYLYNGAEGTEDLTADEFYTIFHYDITDSETIVEDGDYNTNRDAFGVDIPADADYKYYKTITDVDCTEESGNSNATPLSVIASVAYESPLVDPTNLNITNTSDGKFFLNWNYSTESTESTDIFRIYYDDTGDPSAGGDWVLDGTSAYSAGSNLFGYTTTAFADGIAVDFKVVPFASGGLERDNDDFVSGVADAQSPQVVTDTVEVTLL